MNLQMLEMPPSLSDVCWQESSCYYQRQQYALQLKNHAVYVVCHNKVVMASSSFKQQQRFGFCSQPQDSLPFPMPVHKKKLQYNNICTHTYIFFSD